MEEQRTKRTNCKYGDPQINIIGKLQEINYLGRFIAHSLPKPFCNQKIIATTRNLVRPQKSFAQSRVHQMLKNSFVHFYVL